MGNRKEIGLGGIDTVTGIQLSVSSEKKYWKPEQHCSTTRTMCAFFIDEMKKCDGTPETDLNPQPNGIFCNQKRHPKPFALSKLGHKPDMINSNFRYNKSMVASKLNPELCYFIGALQSDGTIYLFKNKKKKSESISNTLSGWGKIFAHAPQSPKNILLRVGKET